MYYSEQCYMEGGYLILYTWWPALHEPSQGTWVAQGAGIDMTPVFVVSLATNVTRDNPDVI